MGGSTSRSTFLAPKQAQISGVTHPNLNMDELLNIDWFEIIRLKNDFEKGCHSVAHRIDRSSIGFLFSSACYGENDIAISEKKGQLFVPNPNDPSKMQLQYKEWFGGNPVDFWIYDYNLTKGYLLVGNQQGMGWLLSNKPILPWCTIREVLWGMEKRGFNLDPNNVWFKWKPITCGGSETTTTTPGVKTSAVL